MEIKFTDHGKLKITINEYKEMIDLKDIGCRIPEK